MADALPAAPSLVDEGNLKIVLALSEAICVTSDLREGFGRALQILASETHVQRACLLLTDDASGRLCTHATFGLPADAAGNGHSFPGQSIVGGVIATGHPRIIADVRQEPEFLDHTGRYSAANLTAALSFLCVPLRSDGRVLGVIWGDGLFSDAVQLRRDHALLEILASLLAQCIRVDRMIGRDKAELLAENQQLHSKARERYRFESIIGDAPAMQEVFATVGQVAGSRATVLLQGETGTGKEMIARALHHNSPRRSNNFVRVNCGALAGTLLESELFGHVKGSFTGAIRDKIGRFEAADGGTIFLDEIGTLGPELQVKLLRVLQERELERVGDMHTIKIDVRVIAATNVDLQEEVAANKFREDLFYRLNVVSIFLPPLRNRREDIPRLVDHFLDKYNAANERTLHKISRQTLATLLSYPWPGNVRELENAMERAVVLSRSDEFTEDLLPATVRLFAAQQRATPSTESIQALTRRLADQAIADLDVREGEIYQIVVDEVERALIDRALKKCNGVKIKAADYLGINRNTLNKKVKDLGIEPKD